MHELVQQAPELVASADAGTGTQMALPSADEDGGGGAGVTSEHGLAAASRGMKPPKRLRQALSGACCGVMGNSNSTSISSSKSISSLCTPTLAACVATRTWGCRRVCACRATRHYGHEFRVLECRVLDPWPKPCKLDAQTPAP